MALSSAEQSRRWRERNPSAAETDRAARRRHKARQRARRDAIRAALKTETERTER